MNLKTEQGRKQAIEEIENSFINSLREIGVELSNEVYCAVYTKAIQIALKATGERKNNGFKTAFASEILLYKNQGMAFGSSGALTPKNKEAYWRTIHAASILKNWEKVCEAVNEHCQRYSELVNQINKQNP